MTVPFSVEIALQNGAYGVARGYVMILNSKRLQASMSIFTRFFRNRSRGNVGTAAWAQDVVDRTAEKTEKEVRPVRELGSTIIHAAVDCLDGIKALIRASDEKEREAVEIDAFQEFLYFFMHLVMRTGSVAISESELKRLQEWLGPLIASTAVDSYGKHWPQNIKDGLVLEFYKNLNAAEVKYAECSRFDSPAPPEERSQQILERLFASLGDRVASIIGHPDSLDISLTIYRLAFHEFSKMDLDKLVADFKSHSMGLPRPPHRF